ncbi:inhibitory synaptic factor 1 [Leucoraja erinacea]|uniref:inhibitory synaptic factor 1 n=1 Tax=Leucoraja erinaceus TaxID=7782 RepID=UPI0024558064|nr:inhibitory synaptic factor 1 [Leucoraja erinacea]
MSSSCRPAQQPREPPPRLSVREAIRNRMKMVIDQLEVILQELKAVAKELKEVVKQIDKLTCDFDFELEPDDWTLATISSTSSSDTVRNIEQCGALSDYGQLGFFTPDILSDSWEFCSFLELPPERAKADPGGDDKELPSTPTEPDYRLMNGGLLPNGPDSSSEETIGGGGLFPKALPRSTGTRERVRFSDKVLYHALCCDDEEDEAQSESVVTAINNTTATATTQTPTLGTAATGLPARTAPTHHRPPRPTLTHPPDRRKVMRNNSTQTVSDKSTQTLLTYGSSTTQHNSKKEDTK